ncbi:uncharacterized protein LOC135487007 [Lineus longissimus]|uniref:uncharacterized protein LOC135487007 n=1 Tax=Lineus longissimus TaxID=88925 RepID=UPI00315D3132
MDQKPDPKSWMDALSWQYGRSQPGPSPRQEESSRQNRPSSSSKPEQNVQSSQSDQPQRHIQPSKQGPARQAPSPQESQPQRPDMKSWMDALSWQYGRSKPSPTPRQEESSKRNWPSTNNVPKENGQSSQPQRNIYPSNQGPTRQAQSPQENQPSKPDLKSWMNALSWQYGRSSQQPPPQHNRASQHGEPPRTVHPSSSSNVQPQQLDQSLSYRGPETCGQYNQSTQYSQQDSDPSGQYGHRDQHGRHFHEYGQPAHYAQTVDSDQPAQCYQIRLYEPGQQQDCPPPVKAPTCRPRSNPDDFKVREAMIPGILLIITSLINAVCLAVLLSVYTRIEKTSTAEMSLALLFYAIVGALGIVSAIWSDRNIAVGIIVMATITCVISGYQICLNASIIYSHDLTRRQFGWPRTYHFQSPAMIIPLANEVVGWLSFILCVTLIVLASKVVCRTCFWCYTWQPRQTIGQDHGQAVIGTHNTAQIVDGLNSQPYSGQPGSFVYTSSSQTKLLDPDDMDAVLRVTSF